MGGALHFQADRLGLDLSRSSLLRQRALFLFLFLIQFLFPKSLDLSAGKGGMERCPTVPYRAVPYLELAWHGMGMGTSTDTITLWVWMHHFRRRTRRETLLGFTLHCVAARIRSGTCR